jgi:hypothetical protein
MVTIIRLVVDLMREQKEFEHENKLLKARLNRFV